ncbi:SEC-C domain-containing protein [Sporosarcina sp. Marseille-Q4063]|uniref:SEC-C metal-binding domain-containing protein n=1 Tax=Sporosarcina sp. Marseille-Q4063 TaxID=2810514 RepID=UPI001BAF1B95|nr:SEC-C metal-binding domain-containing protein [Sporosarcina sp. Marseille-Q4063]QUW21060.1 SEC-C domain-containing protein [Sporosarcina sp. Marseille-Q4063]
MIQRNDPCPCGSGKKYKRCCIGKNEVSIDTLVEEELQRILAGMYEQPITPAIHAEYEIFHREWTTKLSSFWDAKEIEYAVSEYFFYVARRDLWKRYLIKVLNDPIRSAVRSVVETWQEPVILLGNITGEKNGLVVIEEVLGDETYYLEKQQDMPVEKDSVVFGVALRDDRIGENGIFILNSLLFVKDGNHSFVNEITKFAESSGFDKSDGFYKTHMIDIYHRILSRSEGSVLDLLKDELTEIQQEAVDIFYEKLKFLKIEADHPELMGNIIVTYLYEKQPNFKKPEVIAAAFLHALLEFNMFDDYSMAQSELAKLFDVSVSSVTNQSGRIQEFIVGMGKNIGISEPNK